MVQRGANALGGDRVEQSEQAPHAVVLFREAGRAGLLLALQPLGSVVVAGQFILVLAHRSAQLLGRLLFGCCHHLLFVEGTARRGCAQDPGVLGGDSAIRERPSGRWQGL